VHPAILSPERTRKWKRRIDSNRPARGTLTLENQSATQAIAASGLDLSYAFGGAMFTINAPYN